MFKKFLATILAVAMITAMWIIPASAADLVLDKDYGDKAWKGESATAADVLPIPKGYDGNFTLELYVKINDFATPSVIAGAFPDGGATAYAIWVNGGNLYFSAGDTDGNNHVLLGSTYTADWAGKWLHILGVKNGLTNTVYVCPEGSDGYATASTARKYNVVWADATTFGINRAATLFDGAGDFSLGTVRMYNADVSANRLTLKAECEARLAAANATEAPTEEPTPEPTEVPTEAPAPEPIENYLIFVSKPTKMYYTIGEELDLTGLEVITKTYVEEEVDGEIVKTVVKTPVAIEDCTFTGFDSSAEGTVPVTITYESEDTIYSNIFTLHVKKAPETVVTGVGLTTKPDKLYYEVGEALDTTGLSLLVKYADGHTEIISEGLDVTGYDAETVGDQRLTVSYQGQSTGFTVKVQEAIPIVVTGVALVTKPAKLSYENGEALDTTGLSLFVKYSDGTTETISEGLEITGYNAKTAGDQRVTVSYQGQSTGFTVTVGEKLGNSFEDAKFYTSTLVGDDGAVTDEIILPESFTIEMIGSGNPGYLIYAGRYQIQILNDGTVQVWEWNQHGGILKSPETYDPEDDIHVVLVGEGNTLSVYINGELSIAKEADGIVVPGDFNFAKNLHFGWGQSPMIEANFYNQAATAEDVAALYAAR